MPPQKSSPKQLIAPLVALLALAGLIYLGLRSAKEPTVVTPSNEAVSTLEWPSEQVKKETIVDNGKGYEIAAAYPITKSATITGVFSSFIYNVIESFKADAVEGVEMPEGYRPVTLDITYKEEKYEKADNYIFLIYTDTGGAHGLSATRTFVFNKTGEQIKLDDLFTNGINGLGTIADYVKKELMKREFADEKWVSDGAAPLEDNYQNFIVSDAGVTFIFDPYQVAPYAAGIQNVLVPTSAFKAIANPEVF